MPFRLLQSRRILILMAPSIRCVLWKICAIGRTITFPLNIQTSNELFWMCSQLISKEVEPGLTASDHPLGLSLPTTYLSRPCYMYELYELLRHFFVATLVVTFFQSTNTGYL